MKRLSLVLLVCLGYSTLVKADSLLYFDGTLLSTNIVDAATVPTRTWSANQSTGSAHLNGDSTAFFDGGYLSTEDPGNAFDPGSRPFTIDFWIKPHSGGPDADEYLAGKSNPQLGWGYDIRLGGQDGRLRVSGINGWVSAGPGHWTFNMTSAESITFDTWHHVALSATSTTAYLFLDGKLEGSMNRSPNAVADGHAFRIGYTDPSEYGGSAYRGYLDEFRFTMGQALWTGENVTIGTTVFAPSTRDTSAVPLPAVAWPVIVLLGGVSLMGRVWREVWPAKVLVRNPAPPHERV